MDATDHSVGDYGRTHGTGHNLVHGVVDEISCVPLVASGKAERSTTLEMTKEGVRSE